MQGQNCFRETCHVRSMRSFHSPSRSSSQSVPRQVPGLFAPQVVEPCAITARFLIWMPCAPCQGSGTSNSCPSLPNGHLHKVITTVGWPNRLFAYFRHDELRGFRFWVSYVFCRSFVDLVFCLGISFIRSDRSGALK